MPSLASIKQFLLGAPLDPFKQETRHSIALIAFFAWIGLGADGISSSAYGPEEAFAALAGHTQLAVFLALATGITVFIIALAYIQVIELMPNGGGGYRVASKLLGPRAGLVAGSALIVDYILTIAISVSSAVDSFFSVLPIEWQPYKIYIKFLLVIILSQMNLRGAKESIKVLMPVFLGFIALHVLLIVYGVGSHAEGLPQLIPNAIEDSQSMAAEMGWFAVIALFLKAFSMGGGTYTGLESVSNSVHALAEPKVRTGKITMFAVATSLAFMATGIILLYLLWDVERVAGQTMNASAFTKITADWMIGDVNISKYVVGAAMFLTAGLLFVAGNTGFIAGPAVLANMAVDRWMPHLFSALSTRLVTKNGIVLMGVAAILALAATDGRVDLLVVLYSINVFLTFTLSLAGLTKYRWRRRKRLSHFLKMIVPLIALIVCAGILVITIIEKFSHGAWMTILVTGILIWFGLWVRRHYTDVRQRVERVECELANALAFGTHKPTEVPKLEYHRSTAIFIVGENSASGLHTFLWVQKLFPKMFHNFIFVSVGEIDTEEFVDQEKWENLRKDTKSQLKEYVNFCHHRSLPSTYYHAFGTDVVEKLSELTDKIAKKFPHSVFFANKLILDNESIFTQMLFNQTAYILQRKLHSKGRTMIVMPMKL